MKRKVIVGQDGPDYLVRFLEDGETVKDKPTRYTQGQILKPERGIKTDIMALGSLINMQPYFSDILIEDEKEIDKIYAQCE